MSALSNANADIPSDMDTQEHCPANCQSRQQVDENVPPNNDVENSENTGHAWYNDPVYSRFWSHYRSIHSWFRKHDEYLSAHRSEESWYRDLCQGQALCHEHVGNVMNMLGAGEPRRHQAGGALGHYPHATLDCSQAHLNLNHQTLHNVNHHNRKRKSSKKCRSQRKSNHLHHSHHLQGPNIHLQVSNFDPEHGDLDIYSVDGGFEFEMEITDEMMDFFSQSEKHRRERDSKKSKDMNKSDQVHGDVYVELTESAFGKNSATILPPSERPGSRRIAEMKEIYGAGAAMIHGMETAMQLSYDRHADRKRSKLWPAVPINIKFS